ncbi:G-type lectin S-receptor-like serine/threonine-protein kinase [Gossypium arboreum]|uniref:non-specific serine/threonine protein kinase n=2 Tax=Gossypium arboreum TaxID=29729 RepID=A0A0B0PFH1_GOSAR|nr:G-type lectin S-receptor-like serine/threonine-protein kinase [Gossypium arboreum]
MVWTGDLIDMQHFQQFQQAGNFQFFYRLHHSELDGGRKISNLVIVIICVVAACFLVASLWLLWRYKKKVKVSSMPCCKDDDVEIFDVSKSKRKEFSADLSGPSDILIDENQDNGPELPIFNFSVVAAATKNFYEGNKLGQGRFGAVYKGELPGGKEIAVKRLSGKSGQGLEEFKTEIILIARLQHRNLVRLLGCSIHGEEKLLIYEYMPNKSLDNLLFDATKKAELGWRTRLNIIEGIARGLLYLHRDSRLRIIHRDLKASNILLDSEMNPKISDFGMARMFQGNQIEANTVRVIGTYGYMSPEYAMEGLFSVKSDVYSFGVLLLEIVSGQRNTIFRSSDHTSLLSYAWLLWSEDKAMDLVDPSIRDTCSPNEVLKCIHIGMLCVQDSAVHRPTMAAVVLLLESETPTLPMPTKPTYTFLRSAIEEEDIGDAQEIGSSNDLMVTVIVGR